MRHKVAGRILNRTSEHRLAMRRNLAASLIEHETISTTIEKAKDVKPFVEKLITLAKKGTLQSRRRAISMLGDRDIVVEEDGIPVKKNTVIGKLFSEIGPRYLDRSGGYSRIIQLSMRRLGDNGQLVLMQLLGEDEPVKRERKPKKKKTTKKTKVKKAAEKPAEDEAIEETEEDIVEDIKEQAEDIVAEEPAAAEQDNEVSEDKSQEEQESETDTEEDK
jgi:large subunit ribosomal protein L17